MTPVVERTDHGPVAVLTLNRPDEGNAFTSEQVESLYAHMEQLGAEDHVRAVIITGRGRHFSVGGRKAARCGAPAAWERSPQAHRDQYERAVSLIRRVHDLPQPTIAAINGGCAGAGLALALACDLRYASRGARFNTAFLAHGLPGELGAAWFATRLVGTGRARELFLLPSRVDADAAERMGLVNAVVGSDELLETALEAGRRLAAAAPGALRRMRDNLDDALACSLPDYLDRETDRLIENAWTDDSQTAASRPPLLTGSA